MDFEFPRGDTKLFKFKITDMNGQPLTLGENDKLYFTVKKSPKSNDVILQKTLGNGIELGEDGYFHVTITSLDTSNLDYKQYGYDIEIKTLEGIVKTLVIGSITLTEEYTFRRDEV